MVSPPYTWQTLPNPFHLSEANNGIVGHVSGRAKDIATIIAGRQSAIILAGAPRIGKTTFVRYLCETHSWTWSNEIIDLGMGELLTYNKFHFIQLSVEPPKTTSAEAVINDPKMLLDPFIQECYQALHSINHTTQSLSSNLNTLRELLDELEAQHPDTRYFIVLDNIKLLALPVSDFSGKAKTIAETKQEQGLALLDKSGIVRILVDLIDNCSNFGVMLALETLPRSKSTDQFSHISADLARFTTMTLQNFPHEDAQNMLRQPIDVFGQEWTETFRSYGGEVLFSPDEQQWLLQQAGTHPYLLQQLCSYTFYYKHLYVTTKGTSARWQTLQEADKRQIAELVNERLSTFLTRMRSRLQEALEQCSTETSTEFYDFIASLAKIQPYTALSDTMWRSWGPELHYLLYSEGILRYDLFQSIQTPGAILHRYLQREFANSSTQTRGFWLTINCPGQEVQRLSLSELEYGLIKALVQHPKRCTEDELMKSAWGKAIERSTFTQRMHHLRKKLHDVCENKDMIVNHYGGQYSLTHPEWLELE